MKFLNKFSENEKWSSITKKEAIILWIFLIPILLVVIISIVFILTPNKFIDNKDGTVTDEINRLVWEKCSYGQMWINESCIGDATQMTWNDAKNLSFSIENARLPTKDELKTLVFCVDGKYDNEGDCINSEVATNRPTIDKEYFPNTPSDDYWSSTPSATNYNSAWSVDFFSGHSSDESTDYKNYVRLVTWK